MGLFAGLATWLGQNWLTAAAITTLILIAIFAPSVFNFFGHMIQVVFSALPTPAKAVIGLVLVMLLGAVLFNYTIGAQYVCLADTNEVGIVGYGEGLAYKFGVDIVGINDPTYTEKPEDSKSLVVNDENILVTSATTTDPLSIERIDINEINVVKLEESIPIGTAIYRAMSVVVPPNEVGVYKLQSIALLPSKEMMFHRKFGDMNYVIYDVCGVVDRNKGPTYDTCILLPRKDPIGFGTSFEYVTAKPCVQFNAPQGVTGEVSKVPIASISYALVSPENLPKDAPADAKTPDNVYYSEGMWIGIWSHGVLLPPEDAGFFSRVWNAFAPSSWATFPKVDVSVCKRFGEVSSDEENVPDSLTGLYDYEPYMMQLMIDGKTALGPVYNAMLVPLMAGVVKDENGQEQLVPYGDAIDESNKRAQVWHDTLLQNIEKYSAKDGDVIKYSCNENKDGVDMKVMGINFFDPVVLVAIFILTGAITVYGWIMRL